MSEVATALFDKARRPVRIVGRTWQVFGAHGHLHLDWSLVDPLPEYVRTAGHDFVRRLVQTQSHASVASMFEVLVKLGDCASLRSANRVSTAVFEELRVLLGRDHASLQRYRKFYYWAACCGYDGFDDDVADDLYDIVIGAVRTPNAMNGRNPPFTKEQFEWIEAALAAAKPDALEPNERMLLLIELILGSNPGPLAMLRATDLRREQVDGAVKWYLHVPRHKKRGEHERSDFRARHLSDGVAEAYLRHAEANARAMMELGLPQDVAVPMFMRASPRKHFLADDCPVRSFAMHMTGQEIAATLQTAVDKLCDLEKRERFAAAPRRFRRTRLLFARLSGLNDTSVADIADHSSTRSLSNYAFTGYQIVQHLDALMGHVFAELRRAYDLAHDPCAGFVGRGYEVLFKARSFR